MTTTTVTTTITTTCECKLLHEFLLFCSWCCVFLRDNPNFVLIWCGAQIFRGLPWIQFEIFNQHPPTENPVSRQPSKLIFMLSERLNNYFQKKEKHLVIYFSWFWSCIETFENFFVLFEIFYFRYLAFQSQPSSNNIWTQKYHLIIDLWRHPRDRQSPIFFLAA